MSLVQPSQVFPMQSATRRILRMCCGLSKGSKTPPEPNLPGDLYSLLEFGTGEKD